MAYRLSAAVTTLTVNRVGLVYLYAIVTNVKLTCASRTDGTKVYAWQL